jgi:hypothetical protein
MPTKLQKISQLSSERSNLSQIPDCLFNLTSLHEGATRKATVSSSTWIEKMLAPAPNRRLLKLIVSLHQEQPLPYSPPTLKIVYVKYDMSMVYILDAAIQDQYVST